MRTLNGLWPEPRVTGNSALLSGYIIGALSGHKERIYQPVAVDSEAGETIVEHIETGSCFRVHVEQIAGTE